MIKNKNSRKFSKRLEEHVIKQKIMDFTAYRGKKGLPKNPHEDSEGRFCQQTLTGEKGVSNRDKPWVLLPVTAAQAIRCRNHKAEKGIKKKYINLLLAKQTNKKSLFTMAKLQIYFTEHINKAILRHGLLGGPTVFVSSDRCSTLNQKSGMYSKSRYCISNFSVHP